MSKDIKLKYKCIFCGVGTNFEGIVVGLLAQPMCSKCFGEANGRVCTLPHYPTIYPTTLPYIPPYPSLLNHTWYVTCGAGAI